MTGVHDDRETLQWCDSTDCGRLANSQYERAAVPEDEISKWLGRKRQGVANSTAGFLLPANDLDKGIVRHVPDDVCRRPRVVEREADRPIAFLHEVRRPRSYRNH